MTETKKVLIQGIQEVASNANNILTRFINQEEGTPEEGDDQGQEDDEENEEEEELSGDDLEDEL